MLTLTNRVPCVAPQVATGCRLFSPPPPLAATAEDAEVEAASGAASGLPRCFLLQPSGTLHSITVG